MHTGIEPVKIIQVRFVETMPRTPYGLDHLVGCVEVDEHNGLNIGSKSEIGKSTCTTEQDYKEQNFRQYTQIK